MNLLKVFNKYLIMKSCVREMFKIIHKLFYLHRIHPGYRYQILRHIPGRGIPWYLTPKSAWNVESLRASQPYKTCSSYSTLSPLQDRVIKYIIKLLSFTARSRTSPGHTCSVLFHLDENFSAPTSPLLSLHSKIAYKTAWAWNNKQWINAFQFVICLFAFIFAVVILVTTFDHSLFISLLQPFMIVDPLQTTKLFYCFFPTLFLLSFSRFLRM